MITYKLNADNHILETVFEDMISPEDLFNFMVEINSNKDLPRDLRVIIDVRNADFIFEPIAIQSIVKANFRMNRSFKMIKNAILANDPDDATLTLFHQYTQGSKNYLVRKFHDREKAIKWLRRT